MTCRLSEEPCPAGVVPSGHYGADRLSVAPMADVTTSAFRQIMRLFTRRAMLYTPMIAAEALMRNVRHLLMHDPAELPCTLQVGGSDPHSLQAAARLAQQEGFSAINLNAGCPSDKVRCGGFGAVLMREPRRLAELYAALREGSSLEASVKTRIGIDECDSLEYTCELVGCLYEAGCRHVILHARRVWINGLSPRQNRRLPALDHGRVYAVKKHFPGLRLTLNGGVTTLDEAVSHLQQVDGVMLGRAVIDNPYVMAAVDQQIFGEAGSVPGRRELLEGCCELYESRLRGQLAFRHFAGHLLGLFSGCHHARAFRRYLSEHMCNPGADARVLLQAYAAMRACDPPGQAGEVSDMPGHAP